MKCENARKNSKDSYKGNQRTMHTHAHLHCQVYVCMLEIRNKKLNGDFRFSVQAMAVADAAAGKRNLSGLH